MHGWMDGLHLARNAKSTKHQYAAKAGGMNHEVHTSHCMIRVLQQVVWRTAWNHFAAQASKQASRRRYVHSEWKLGWDAPKCQVDYEYLSCARANSVGLVVGECTRGTAAMNPSFSNNKQIRVIGIHVVDRGPNPTTASQHHDQYDAIHGMQAEERSTHCVCEPAGTASPYIGN